MMRVPLILMIFLSASAIAEFQPTGVRESQINCLALNIYHEARNQTTVGQVAVAHVTFNRVMSHRYPNNFCDVVKQGYKPGRRDCHFSWYCDGKPDTPKNEKVWNKIYTFARWFVYNHDYVVDPTDGSTHYHATKVRPWWSEQITFTRLIGDHAFYVE